MVKCLFTAKSALLVAASVLPMQAVMAQGSPDETPETDENVIVVSGSIVQALQSSIGEKRRAVNVTDIASSDDVGRFPDENIAAALTRLPGVATQVDQGQPRYIQVRGAPNRWTSVSIDGIPQTGTDEGQAGRAFRFDAVPAVILSQLRINKSLTPDITAEAVTANVDLITFSPLEQEGISINGDIGYGFMDLGNGEQRQGSLRASYSEETWGITLGGSHYRREQVTNTNEANYREVDGVIVPQDFDFRTYFTDRETNGAYGTIEFKPVSGQRFFATGIFTQFLDFEQRNQYEFELRTGVGTRTPTEGELFGVEVEGAFNDATYRNENIIGLIGSDLEFDDWGLSFRLGYTNTLNTTRLPLTLTETARIDDVSLTYERSDPRFPRITGLFRTDSDGLVDGNFVNPRFGTPITSLDQLEFTGFNFILPIITRSESDAYTARLDTYKEFDDFTIRAGAMYQRREIAGNIFGDVDIVPLSVIGQDANAYLTNQPWDNNFNTGIPFTYTANEQLNIDQERLLEQAGINLAELNAPSSLFDQEETIISPYVMGEFDFGALRVVAGVRAEYYDNTVSGFSDAGGVQTPLSFQQDFFDFFPSVNLTYEITPDLLLRFAGTRGTARPAYAAVRIGSSIDDNEETIDAGNPELIPEKTWGLDGSLEYYLPSNGIVSVAVFSRFVEDVLFASSLPVTSDAFDTDQFDRTGYLLDAQFNGESGTVLGVEFNFEHQFDFLPGALSGFGFQGNLTLLDGEFDAIDETGQRVTSPFQGLSDTIVNTSIFYEKYGVSARVAYQWRSDFIDTIGGLGIGDGDGRGAFENLDITLRYQVNDNIALFADLANVTNEVYTAFQGTTDFPVEVEQIGSRYLFGVRFDF